MRRIIMTLGIILAAGFLASQAMAWWGGGHMGSGWGHMGFGQTGPSAERNRHFEQFRQDTAGLRGDLASARAELQAELNRTNPDRDRVVELNRRIAEHRAELRQQAFERGMYGGRGYGPGSGGYCWR